MKIFIEFSSLVKRDPTWFAQEEDIKKLDFDIIPSKYYSLESDF